MIILISIIALTASLVYLLNKKYPVDGAFEVSNYFGRIIAVLILVVAAVMALTRMTQ